MDCYVRASITHILTSIFGDIDRLDHNKGLEVGPSENVEWIFQHLAQDAEKYASHFSIDDPGKERAQFCLSYKIWLHI